MVSLGVTGESLKEGKEIVGGEENRGNDRLYYLATAEKDRVSAQRRPRSSSACRGTDFLPVRVRSHQVSGGSVGAGDEDQPQPLRIKEKKGGHH